MRNIAGRVLSRLKVAVVLHQRVGNWWVPVVVGPGRIGRSNLRFKEGDLYRAVAGALHSIDGDVLDVGAHIGEFLLTFLELRSSVTQRYVGFEPALNAANYLRTLVTANDLRGVEILPVALADRLAVPTLHRDAEFASGASIAPEGLPLGRFAAGERVICLPGDLLVAELALDRVALIKIDVEGAEWQVLRGLGKTVDRLRPRVLFEMLPHDVDLWPRLAPVAETVRTHRREQAEGLQEYFAVRGYDLYQLVPGEPPRAVRSLLEFGSTRKLDQVNFLGTPRELPLPLG